MSQRDPGEDLPPRAHVGVHGAAQRAAALFNSPRVHRPLTGGVRLCPLIGRSDRELTFGRAVQLADMGPTVLRRVVNGGEPSGGPAYGAQAATDALRSP